MIQSVWRAAAAAMVLCVCAATRTPASGGALVIVGGGGTTAPICARALELARGSRTKVVVLPQASADPESGAESAQMWREAGAAQADVVDFADVARARQAIAAADLVWIGGGDQVRFMQEVRAAGMLELLVERHQAGVVFGGTSAGAAVMSQPMITGEPEDAVEKLAPGSVEIAEGLGLLRGTIVDQHFVVRRRHNRLLSAVLAQRDHIGFGIDERTALIALPERFEVVGEGPVVVIDARAAEVAAADSGAVWSARGVRLDVLRQGDRLPRR